jgi:TPR repeat protein
LKQCADQGDTIAQCRYGLCLQDGEGVSIDLRNAAHYFKLSADQGNADGQCYYGICLRDGEGVSIDLSDMKVIVVANILVDRGNVFLAVTIAHHSDLFGNLVKKAE